MTTLRNLQDIDKEIFNLHKKAFNKYKDNFCEDDIVLIKKCKNTKELYQKDLQPFYIYEDTPEYCVFAALDTLYTLEYYKIYKVDYKRVDINVATVNKEKELLVKKYKISSNLLANLDNFIKANS